LAEEVERHRQGRVVETGPVEGVGVVVVVDRLGGRQDRRPGHRRPEVVDDQVEECGVLVLVLEVPRRHGGAEAVHRLVRQGGVHVERDGGEEGPLLERLEGEVRLLTADRALGVKGHC
jgi:hypothetical protein